MLVKKSNYDSLDWSIVSIPQRDKNTKNDNLFGYICCCKAFWGNAGNYMSVLSGMTVTAKESMGILWMKLQTNRPHESRPHKTKVWEWWQHIQK